MTLDMFLLIIILSTLGIILFYLILFIAKEHKKSLYERRFSSYALNSKNNLEEPVFEIIYRYLWKFIKKTNSIFEKSVFLKKYSKHFEKYIKFDDRESKSGMDYISLKTITAILFGILYLVTSIIRDNFNINLLIIIMFLSFFLIDLYFLLEYKNRIKKIENDLLSAIIIMNNAFKSGMNIVQAIDIVKTELEGPIKDEFQKISIDIKYGLSLEIVFERFYNRVKLESAKYITTSLSLINKTGGNIVEVFSSIEKNFYDNKKIKDEMSSLTSSSVFMYRMLTFMPILLVIFLVYLNPGFFTPLITTSIGRILLILIILIFIIYIVVIKRIMKVDL